MGWYSQADKRSFCFRVVVVQASSGTTATHPGVGKAGVSPIAWLVAYGRRDSLVLVQSGDVVEVTSECPTCLVERSRAHCYSLAGPPSPSCPCVVSL